MDRPWENEPDLVEFSVSGIHCLIRRVPMEGGGHLCGYIQVPQSHPVHGLTYQDDWEKDLLPGVHGGWTYSEAGSPLREEDTPGEWWIGFDCLHSGDGAPKYILQELGTPVKSALAGTYRDISYVRFELERAAGDLIRMLSAHQRLELLRAA